MTKAELKGIGANAGPDLFDSSAPATVFFPCNRETALLFLGALCVSDSMTAEVDLATEHGHIALLEDGLRGEEEQVVSAGDSRRFPILLEFPANAVQKAPSGTWAIPMGQLCRLLFRGQEHADEFRFRPVDEVNTESLPFGVEPNRFGLAGNARFGTRRTVPTHDAILTDRLAAGIHYTIMLGDRHVASRTAAIDFFDGLGNSKVLPDTATLQSCFASLAGGGEESGLLRSILAAFASLDSAHEIIRAIGAAPLEDRKLRRWTEIAQGVLQNRVELSGEQLSDDGSIVLRGALLGLTAETPSSIGRFLDGERPAGPHVAVFAAFLAGMRKGVLNLAWSEKQPALAKLSTLTTALLLKATEVGGAPGATAIVARSADKEHRAILSVAGVPLADWPLPARPSMMPSALGEMLERQGFRVQGAGRTPGAVLFWLADTTVELQPPLGEAEGFCVLRVYLSPARKLRKKTEIAEAFKYGGMLWYPGPLDAEEKYLFCDLPHTPAASDAAVLIAKLTAALATVLAPEKPRRSRSKPRKLGSVATPNS